MSYILDALKKSEQQRQRGAVPSLVAAQAAEPSPREPRLLWYGAGAAVLLVAGIAIGVMRPWQTPSSVPPAVATTAREAPVVAPPPAVAPAPVAPPAPPPAPAAVEITIKTEPAPVPRPPAPPAEAPKSPAPSAAGSLAQAPGVGAQSASPAPGAAAQAPNPAQGAPAQTQSPTPGAQPPGVAQGAPTAAPAAKAPPVAAPRPVETAPVPLAELPLAIQQELPKLTIQFHMYSRTPANRLVGINNLMLREGDAVAPGLVLEQVTPDGMVLKYKEYRFLLGNR